MKNLAFGVISFFICISLIICIVTIQGKDTRKQETQEAVSNALKAAGEELKKDTYTSNEEFEAAFMELFLAQINSASNVTVTILESDYEKGILSVEAVETYTHPNGKTGKVACQKTIILERSKDEIPDICTVRFYTENSIKEENLYKSYTLTKGEALKEPKAPSGEGRTFLGWVNAGTDEPADFTNTAEESMNFYAVWREE